MKCFMLMLAIIMFANIISNTSDVEQITFVNAFHIILLHDTVENMGSNWSGEVSLRVRCEKVENHVNTMIGFHLTK
ncbi:unnamed protein product [Schistosoma mansoni]|uniref:Smp_201170 n=1 Tax=Schistosoma mansoni TaxID=6183 RepID=UPI00022C8372|nr:unnamed protein product [Schistosoma mansoni]|eukprot:XP_018644920.1 unnamed protein product [Schistosoma mansoni]